MRTRAIAVVALLVAASCSGDDDSTDPSGATASASTAATSSTAPASTVAVSATDAVPSTAPPTTAAPSTDPAPTTAPSVPPTTAPPTTAAQPAALVLRSDGIGPVAFGTSEADALAALEVALGPVTSEIANTYPNDLGDGTFLDDANTDAFAYRAQRTACFDNALCVVFGGDAPGSLAFVGWVQNNQGVDAPLATSAGITAGSIWADHVDTVEVDEFGCYSIGYGTTDGISLVLSSAGEPFLAFDEEGNAVASRPDPADVTVIELEAGTHPFFVGEDC